jgi:hypothetical protein
MAVASVKVTATPAEVRAFARAQGLPVGKRGRFAPSLVKAFNDASPVKYVEAGHVPAREVTVTAANHRKVTRRVNPAQVRAAAKAAGIEVGARGRLPREVINRFVLGTL